jgi:colanic acid/amylovoran biosynthesis glycosyltransferase
VGRMTWEKGYEHAMAAIAKLRDRGVDMEYRVIGDGPLMEGLCFQRYRLGLEGVVTFLGAMDRSRVREEMRACDLFLHASVSEGFCNSVLEAQAMEIPVVCSDAGGLPENVEDGVTGKVVPRRDAEALAEALARLAMDPPLESEIGEGGEAACGSTF